MAAPSLPWGKYAGAAIPSGARVTADFAAIIAGLSGGWDVSVANITDSGLTAGGIPIISTGGLLVYDSALLWDATNKRVGIGVTPTVTLDTLSTSSSDTIAARFSTANASSYVYSENSLAASTGNIAGFVLRAHTSTSTRTLLNITGNFSDTTDASHTSYWALIGVSAGSSFSAISATGRDMTLGDAITPGTNIIAGKTLAINNLSSVATSGTDTAIAITSTVNQASGTAGSDGIKFSQIETALGSGTHNLINLLAGVAGTTSKFSVTNAGVVTATTFVGALTGNADTATKLAATKTIGGVAFDGSANITVASATGGFAVSGGNLTAPGVTINSAAAPTLSQLTVQSNAAGMISMLTYAADNSFIGMDVNYNNAHIAQSTSAFEIQKSTGTVLFRGNTGLTPGNSFSPATLMTLDLSNGNLGIGMAPGYPLDVNGVIEGTSYRQTTAATASILNTVTNKIAIVANGVTLYLLASTSSS